MYKLWACIIMVEGRLNCLALITSNWSQITPTIPWRWQYLMDPEKLGRDCAKAVNEIFLNKGKSRFLLRPLEEPIVRNRRTGPQQTCAIAFKIDESGISMVTTTAQMHTCIYIKVMELK
ncbi:hypothetical protein DPMN_108646 [Dreissena polymorpha]|uniref:Uncharacterized protein n=1 Tax=Dreissena polymorpha TaxID=45954 RepID=A0A9D4K957_DREPO|nr:hypothetical protein DPMN_108646 [Dreissena polymorpha]